MARYVTSLQPNARRAHLGYPATACGVQFYGPHRVTENMPADRRICDECVRSATANGWITRDEAAVLLGRDRRAREQRGRLYGADELLPLLIDGRTDQQVASSLGVSARTVSRMVADAMRAAGARTRFQWGHLIGSAQQHAI